MDGSNLADYMLELGHDVCGIIRRHSWVEGQQHRIEGIKHKINLEYGDMTDKFSIDRALNLFKPDYIFNTAAMSQVRISFDVPSYTFDVNAHGVLNLLESYRCACPKARMYQCSSSEQFGLSVDDDRYQRESTPMNPTSPYGVAKVAAYNFVRHYRRAYGLFACNGILFNHSGVRRGINFIEQKICKSAVEIKLGIKDKLEVGNLDTYRDFGSSFDYVRAMWKIVNHTEPDDFVVSTMETRSIRQMCDVVFGYLSLDYKDYVVQNPRYMRPEELPYLKGDSTKARTVLGWKPEYTFESMMHEMVDHWMDIL